MGFSAPSWWWADPFFPIYLFEADLSKVQKARCRLNHEKWLNKGFCLGMTAKKQGRPVDIAHRTTFIGETG